MPAPTEVYVDPSIAANTGTGTIGDPYGDLQFAMNDVVRDATNGNRFNVKAGTAEILTAALSLNSYGTPNVEAPLLFEGYTSAAGDGGIGDMNGNGGNFSLLPNNGFIIVKNMKMRNTGTAAIIPSALAWATFDTVEFSASTANPAVNAGVGERFINCSFVGFTTSNQVVLSIGGGGAVVTGCWFDINGALAALNIGFADAGIFFRNIINVASTSIGIRVNNVRGGIISHNSILSAGGVGVGIALSGLGADGSHILSNIISGFSGSGGIGLEVTASSHVALYGHNYFHNNETDESGVSGAVFNNLGNTVAGATDPFLKSGANTFANRGSYFEPANIPELRGVGYPIFARLDVGAVQHADAPGGAGYSRSRVVNA